MTYDGVDGYVLLYDASPIPGETPTFANSTWMFEGGKWTHLSASGGSPFGGWLAGLTYDSSDGYVVATGLGSYPWTLTYKAGVWADKTTQPQPENETSPYPGLGMFAISDDPDSTGAMLFGGYANNFGRNQNATWDYEAGNWTELPTNLSPSPLPSNGSAAVYDPALAGGLLFGGSAENGYFQNNSNSTWLLHNNSWENLTDRIGGAPPTLYGMGFCWDSTANEALLFGGSTQTWYSTIGGSPPPANGYLSDQTWVLSTKSYLSSASIQPSSVPADVGALIRFVAHFAGGTSPYSLNWSFGDGSGSRLSSPVHQYAGIGLYTVSVEIGDSSGQATTSSTTLRVVTPLSVTPQILPDPAEVGVAVSFLAQASSGSGGITTAWAYGDGSSVDSVGLHMYASAASYSVQLWANDSGGEHIFDSLTLTVEPALERPQPIVSSSAPTLGEVVSFRANVTGGVSPYTLAWTFGDGSTAGDEAAPLHAYSSTGAFEVSLRVKDALGILASGYLNLTVGPPPPLEASVTESPSSLPVRDLLTIETQVQYGTAPFEYVYSGLPPGCTSQDSPTVTCSPITAGTYSILVTVTDAKGASANASVSILVTATSANSQTAPQYLGLPIFEWVALIGGVGVVGLGTLLALLRRSRTPPRQPPA
jgi:PKD repeat protein